MPYKVVVSDLDWTLLNDEHKISEYTKYIIKKLINRGIKFIIATGRHYKDAAFFKNQLETDSYLISGNGSKVHDKNNKEIISYNIDKEITTKLLNIKVSKNVIRGVYHNDNWFTEKMIPDFDEYHIESGFKPKIIDFERLKNEKIAKIFYITENNEKKEEIKKLKKDLEKISFVKKYLTITASLENCIEIMQKNATKGRALKEILDIERINPREVIAFGDGLNDMEMLDMVGKGIIMGNGSSKLKELLPHLEVIATSSEDAEAHYLQKIFNL